jgi:hypothetical protein
MRENAAALREMAIQINVYKEVAKIDKYCLHCSDKNNSE